MKTCLVVDDGAFDRELLKRSAASLGFEVSEASSGEEALTMCRSSLPDYMLLDWEMEGMNGISVLQAIRAMTGGAATCIIICTANEHPSFIGHAYIQGANGYVVKPITREKLRIKLEEITQLS